MITFSQLGSKGNIGNQLFQIASTIGIATRNKHDFVFPEWKFSKYFQNPLPKSSQVSFPQYKENDFRYQHIEFDKNDVDLFGWFQSEKYFDIKKTKYYFNFQSDFIGGIKARLPQLFAKKTIFISIRRGDFVNHPDYFQLPIYYYCNALTQNFSNWRSYNLIFASDDVDYVKFHFSFLENAFFLDQLSGIEQLAVASLCDHFVVSNSTFSWWSAWLGEKPHSKIYRPLHNFTDAKNKIDSDLDYFPDRWQVYDHTNSKIPISNAAIMAKSNNYFLKLYFQNNFDINSQVYFIDDEHQIDLLKVAVFFDFVDTLLPPPFAIFWASQSERNIKCVLKGLPIKASRVWDAKFLWKNFDFGFFSTIFNSTRNKVSKKAIFFCHQLENTTFDFRENQVQKQEETLVIYSFAGKIGGFFQLTYFIKSNISALIVLVKNTVKKVLFLNKK